MAYDNIPTVAAIYNDGALALPRPAGQPRILILGTGDGGLSYETYSINSIRAAETEFGATSELLQGAHEAFAQDAQNVALMRVGGKQGSFVFTDSAGGTLTITPEYRDDEILDRYALAMSVSAGEQRIAIYDLVDEIWVYDSDDILVIDEGIVQVVNDGLDLFSIGNFSYPSTLTALADIVIGDFTVEGTATAVSAVATQGTDGSNSSLVERYAALNTAYHLLDFKDADYVIPRGVYIDDANIVDGDTTDYFKGVPAMDATTDVLGYLWQYIYQGKLYTYFVDRADYFTAQDTADYATLAIQTDLILTALKTGTGGNKISIQINAAGAAGPTVTISEPADDELLISVVDNGTATLTAVRTAINNALAAYTTSTGVLASTLVEATGTSGTTVTTLVETPLAGGLGGHVLTHQDLTGDSIPAAVSTAFAAATDAQLRECNFAHQLASFCYLSSTTWKAVQGAISFKPPTDYSRAGVSAWAGELPNYELVGNDLAITSSGKNGTGILGTKLLAGKSASAGYRASMVVDGDANDSLAFGGLILTVGDSLPNEGWPYGISDGDEALDENGEPIDIGKHIYVTYDWPVHQNAFDNSTPYRGPVTATLAAKLSVMPENQEPIGDNGLVKKVTSSLRLHSTQIDALARMRTIGLRLEEGYGYIFVSCKTGAHPDSDWTRSSTIRSVNRALEGIRTIARPYLGKAFSSTQLLSLNSAIESYLVSERKLGFNQGAVASLSYTKSDKILGRLTVELTIVPPFSVERITVNTTLAADESEL